MSTTQSRHSELVSLNLGLVERLTVEFSTDDLALASTAVSLLAVRSQLSTASQEDRATLQESMNAMLAVFDQILTSQRRNIRFISSLCLEHPKMTVMLCAPQALESIGDSLTGLAEAGLFSGPTSGTLVHHLIETCEGHPALEAALASFNGIRFAPVAKHLDVGEPAIPVLTLGVSEAGGSAHE